jgi:regulator of protease activity HflC (stomatin/prohibitin superfamily)
MMRVPSGVYCLVQRFGKDIGEVPPGLNWLPAWYRIAYIVSKQSCTYDAPVLQCPTADDVRVAVDVVLVFAINDPTKFIYKLGAKNFDDFLSGTVDEAIRVMVRKETHATVYSLRGSGQDLMLKTLNEKFLESGVRFSDVKVTSVFLPDNLAECLETTTKLQVAMSRLVRQNEYEMLEIKLESEMAIEEIRRKCEQVLVAESGRKRRAELEFEQRSVKAEEDGRVILIQSEGKADAEEVEIKARKDRTKLQFETLQVTEVAKAQAAAGATKVEADHEQERALIEADYKQAEMEYEAGVLRAHASYEKDAYRLLVRKRRHEYELKEKQILAELAETGKFNLIGTSGDKMVQAMMSGTFSAKL